MSPRDRPLYVTPAGVAATLVLFGLAALFVRLGFWQLDRLEQRQTRNAAVAERFEAGPLALETAPADTAGLLYRRVLVEGTYDEPRSVVWAGRSYRSTPGVQVLTPLRLDAGGPALLVDRGWLPSPDAATVDLSALPPAGRVELAAVLLPMPTDPRATERAAPPGDRTLFRLDARRLHDAFPYPIADAYAQVLPREGAAGAPQPVPPPSLSEGSHFSYALQWFGFAAIAVIGWAAVVLRGDGRGHRAADA